MNMRREQALCARGISLYFLWYRDVPITKGTFSNGYGIMGIFFTIFRLLAELCVTFSGNSSEFPKLRPRFSFDLHNYSGIMALKILQNLRNCGYQSFGKNGTSLSDDKSRCPPPSPWKCAYKKKGSSLCSRQVEKKGKWSGTQAVRTEPKLFRIKVS